MSTCSAQILTFPSIFSKKQKKERTYFINDDYEMSPVRTLSESAMMGGSEYYGKQESCMI